MSWIKSALSKAAEAGGKNIGPNLTKTVKTYAGSVYQQAGQAVVGGAKIVQDRLSGRNLNNFKHAVKRLDEVALNARGEERKQALARWLGALKEIDNDLASVKRAESPRSHSDGSGSPGVLEDEPALSPRRASMVLFFDADTGGDLLNFRDVFLRSHAVENIVTSIILEAPTEEEVAILVEMLGLCLTGGQEVHHAIVSSVQDLSKAVSGYRDEVLMEREELLQMARDAVSGLKLNPEVERLDMEIEMMQQQITEKEGVLDLKDETSKPQQTASGLEPSTTLDIIQLQVRLRQSIQRKSLALQAGDNAQTRTSKVQKLKDLAGVLSSTSEDLQKQLLENQQQKDDAMNFRVTKAQEVTEVEKVVAEEVRELDKRRQELETELKEVRAALSAATARHIHTQEEKEQFDEANSNMVAHLSLKEEQLSRSVTSRGAEESIARCWANFLEDTWLLQSASVDLSVNDTKTTWDKSKQHFFQIAAINLVCRQEEASLFLKRLKFLADELESSRQKKTNVGEPGSTEESVVDITKAVGKLQNNYLETESQVEKMFQGISQLEEEMRQYQSPDDEPKSEEEIKLVKNFEALATLKKEIDSLQRPDIEVEKVEKKAMQQGRAIFEKARAQVIETGDRLRAVTSKHDNAKDSSPRPHITHSDEEKAVNLTEHLSPKSPSSNHPDAAVKEPVHDTETEGWEFDELEEADTTEETSIDNK